MHKQHIDPANANPASVIALHCSGAGASQWRPLGEALGSEYELIAPEHYGCEQTGPWTGTHAFTLADEAVRTIELIDRSDDKVHLVGHSYGGGVALHAALARPDRIASMSLYEPSAFHLLRAMGDRCAAAFAEISGLARETAEDVVVGDCKRAAATFVDYWSGPGTWNAMRPGAQKGLIRWAPKAPLDFRALIEEPTPLADYARLRMPVLILRGEFAPRPAREIAVMLPCLLPNARLTVVDGAGHMGPLTHGATVAELIAAHIVATTAANRHQRGRRLLDAAMARTSGGLPALAGAVS